MERITKGCIDAVRWSKAENDLLLSLVGTTTYRNIKRLLPGRSLEAIKRQAARQGYTLYQGTTTLQQLMRDSGYNWKQLLRARDKLGQRWMKANKGRSKYLIQGDQVIALLDYLGDEPYPFVSRHGQPRLTWARYHSQCVLCGTTKTPHAGRGRCANCIKKEDRAKKKAAAQQATNQEKSHGRPEATGEEGVPASHAGTLTSDLWQGQSPEAVPSTPL